MPDAVAETALAPRRYGVEFVLLTGAGVLALGGLVSRFLAPESTDLDLAHAARAARHEDGLRRT
ncbi:hypothetical protein Q5762_02870 [Streptomyces sp. P9(2023)]|uniref:hypothetical protein n=1 Tax=Streptomyces sp. P9(2023) TaxID=3064394 RepID=UPI0028F41A70|nr:hypothetical protein [Streptomyces sp. P9(2023)]MDT9687305.1 hypothetical protein [Streptomyces sp. P9(2023)]